MAQRRRPHRLEVKLTDAEHEALSARARERGVPMATVLRETYFRNAEVSPPPDEVPSRRAVLAQLAVAADGGSVHAMTVLARELRLEEPAPVLKPGPVTAEELARELRVVR